ncbi:MULTISPECIES: hypothetical protein [unclassified Kitasatospora]|uniref:hypothetical protein n=1 Tax=unclassified Kitasatospora TaxID=2633591 RepID=UPI0033D0DF36
MLIRQLPSGILRACALAGTFALKHFELLECTPAGEILLLHRKQRLLLRVPVPQDFDTLPAAVEAALKAFGTGRLALKKQHAPVNWCWLDTAGQVVHL